MANFTISSEIAAPVETVFDVLTDHRGYAKITPLRSSTLEREGSPDPNGVGAVRVHLESRLHAEAAAPDGIWAALVRPVINQLLKGVVKESERRAEGSAG